jgi:AcrR family transcriptional regulator
MAHTTDRRRKPNPRGAGAHLRDEIVDATIHLVADRADPSGITLRGIARAAGITAPSIYAHFDNLDAVMSAVIDRAFEKLSASLEDAQAAPDEPVPRLHALCQAYIAFAVADPQLYGLLFSRDQVPAHRATESGPKSIDTMPGAHAFALLVQAVDACVAAGRSTSTDPQRDATLLWAALHGYVGLLHSAPDFPWPPRASMIDQYADRLAFLTP